jgi:hypothetical protein
MRIFISISDRVGYNLIEKKKENKVKKRNANINISNQDFY